MLKLTHQAIKPSHHDELYDLLKEGDFPDLPGKDLWDERIVNNIFPLGVFEGNKLVAALILFKDMTHPHALGFDAACRKEYASKWASPALFKKVFQVAFEHFDSDYLFSITSNRKAKKSLVTLGFNRLYTDSENKDFFVLNRNHVLPRLRA